MAREKLFIKGIFIPLSKSMNAAITKSIADISDPDKRKATFSKTAKIPNSKEANEAFGSVFEINLIDGSFNVTKKADLLYLVDDEPLIVGYCQLKNILQKNNKDIGYEIVMFGSIANIFREMGELFIEDLDLSRWDHPFDKTVQADSWDTQIFDNSVPGFIPFELGQGYVYPLIDFGLTTDLNNFTFEQMSTCIYVREYILAIFSEAGFTFSSAFFDSTYFKSLIIPSSPASFQLISSEIDDRQFIANTTEFADTGTDTSVNLATGGGFGPLGVLKFTNETSDPGGNYDPFTGVATIINTGVYNFNALVDIAATFTPIVGVPVVTTSDIDGRLELFINGVVAQSVPFYITYDDFPSTFTIGARSTDLTPEVTTNNANPEYILQGSFSSVVAPVSATNNPRQNDPPNRYLASFQNLALNIGNTVEVRIKARYRGLNGNVNHMFEDTFGTGFGGNAVLNIEVGVFYNKVVNTYPAYGSFLKIGKTIPKNIKQKDFFMSIVKMFNLWMDIDPGNSQNLIIEPRKDFLSGDIIKIQDKIDQGKDLKQTPMGKLDAVNFLYTYTPDKDHYNEKYTSQHTRVYGERTIETENDFVRGQKTTKIIFSPTPIVAPPLSDRVLPTIIEVDDLNQPKETDSNIRILFYGGLLPTFTNWNLIHFPVFNIPLAQSYNVYPYAGHFDHPFNATEDINFGLVKEVYYDDDIQPITITNNNLYNKYHSDMLRAYTDKDSRIVTVSINLTPTDFKTWTFDKLYHFENAYFRLNKIMNYNPTGEGLTKCEFLFLTDVSPFKSTTLVINGETGKVTPDGSGGAINDDEDVPPKGTKNSTQPNGGNFTGRGQDVQGDNNRIASDTFNVKIQGNNNRVFSEAEFINIHGDNNTVGAGFKNVTLIDCDSLFIEESNVTYINNRKVTDMAGMPTAVEVITASQSVDVDVLTYCNDTTGGDIVNTFELAFITYTVGQIWYFKKEVVANKMIITVSGGTIDGVSSKTYKPKNTSIAVQYKGGTEFKVL